MSTLEQQLIYKVQKCWGNPKTRYGNDRKYLYERIKELRNYRSNRESNPDLHKQLEKEFEDSFAQLRKDEDLPAYLRKSEAWDLYFESRHRLVSDYDTFLKGHLDE